MKALFSINEMLWKPAWRIIPSRFPPIHLFERIANPEDLEALYALESLTNDRIREEVGDLFRIPPDDRVCGPGSSVLMAPFTHLNPCGSRFSDGTFGVFYAAQTLNTAIAETRYHREQFLRATQEGPIDLDMRVYTLQIKGAMHDLRGHSAQHQPYYHPDNYQFSQQLGRDLKMQNASGIVYHSVRDKNGINCAIFSPKLLSDCQQERHLCYKWDGSTISMIIQKEIVSGTSL